MFSHKCLAVALIGALLVQSLGVAICPCTAVEARDNAARVPGPGASSDSDDCDCALCAARAISLHARAGVNVRPQLAVAMLAADVPSHPVGAELQCPDSLFGPSSFSCPPCLHELATLRE